MCETIDFFFYVSKVEKKEKKYCRATNSHQKAHKIQIFFHTNFHHFHHHHLFHRLLHILSICIIVRASERATGVIMVRETNRIIAVVTFFFLFPRPFSFLLRVVEPTRARSSFLKSPPPPRKVGFVDKNARSFLKRTTG